MKLHSLYAFFLREVQAARSSRLTYVFPALLLAAGCAPLLLGGGGDVATAAPLLLLQALLYLIPLLATLIGVNSAQAESAENLLLLSMPTHPVVRVLGKFGALIVLQALALVLLFLPSVIAGAPFLELAELWVYGAVVAAVFLALGLAVGLCITDAVKAHLAALGLWLVFTFGFSLIGYSLAAVPWIQGNPEAWLAMLMLSPLEALRVGALFSIEAVPFAIEGSPALAKWWLGHPLLWFLIVGFVWMSALLAAGQLGARRAA